MDAQGIALQRLKSYFSQLRSQSDISPAQRYRLEGYLQALLEAGLINAAWLTQSIEVLASNLQGSGVLYGNKPLLLDPTCPWRLPLIYPPAPVEPSS